MTVACKSLTMMAKAFVGIITTTIDIASGSANLDLVMEDRYFTR